MRPTTQFVLSILLLVSNSKGYHWSCYVIDYCLWGLVVLKIAIVYHLVF